MQSVNIVWVVSGLHFVIVNSRRVVLCIFYFLLNILSHEVPRKNCSKLLLFIINKMSFEVQWLNG